MAVIGEGDLAPDDLRWASARELGRLAVEAGFRVATGGLDGVMAAASRGAAEAHAYREGDVIGVLPSYDRATANEWVDIVIPSGLGIARNVVLMALADVVVAIGGGAGTLSEIAIAWQLGRPVVAVQGLGWAGRLGGQAVDARRTDVVASVGTATEAVARALDVCG
jgi:hypothetical protein